MGTSLQSMSCSLFTPFNDVTITAEVFRRRSFLRWKHLQHLVHLLWYRHFYLTAPRRVSNRKVPRQYRLALGGGFPLPLIQYLEVFA
jgi:hypothetical protein